MKAKERIERYGLEKYLRSCRKQGMSEARMDWYKDKYGYDIPVKKPKRQAKPIRYKQSLWHIEMEREGETWSGTSASALHTKSDHSRDLVEAYMNAQKQAGESGWALISYKFLGYKKPYTEHYEYVEYKVPTPKDRETKIPEWKIRKAMDAVGVDPDKVSATIQKLR